MIYAHNIHTNSNNDLILSSPGDVLQLDGALISVAGKIRIVADKIDLRGGTLIQGKEISIEANVVNTTDAVFQATNNVAANIIDIRGRDALIHQSSRIVADNINFRGAFMQSGKLSIRGNVVNMTAAVVGPTTNK